MTVNTNNKVYAFAANGTEETELLCVVDILRRAGILTVIASIDGARVTGSHGITFDADALAKDCDFSDAEILFVPGGLPGTTRLAESSLVINALKTQAEKNKRIAAICAAPALVLGENGLLDGKQGVCSPGFETHMKGCEVLTDKVCTDGNITTARGLGCAVELGLELVRLLCNETTAEDIKRKICY